MTELTYWHESDRYAVSVLDHGTLFSTIFNFAWKGEDAVSLTSTNI